MWTTASSGLQGHLPVGASARQPSFLPASTASASIRHNVVACAGKNWNKSFDSEDELDRGLAEQLKRQADPQAVIKQAKHLELAWLIAKPGRVKPEPCDACHGAKEKECDWCHGTGVMTVGDVILQSTATHSSKCPVCRGTGYCKCEHCRGTGFRAKWMGPSSNKVGA